MKARTGKRRGFTLVELLVVISIIGMLMAMLLPAVQSARETARANDCRNNMRNWALACVQFDVNRGYFPGYINDLEPSAAAAPETDGNNYRSWMFAVLPYQDNRAVYDKYYNGTSGTAGVEDPNYSITHHFEVAICKSNPPEALNTGSTSYACNVGQVDVTPSSSSPSRDGLGNGVFHYRSLAASGEIIRTMSSAYITSNDGITNTIMLSENADAYTWPGVYDDSANTPSINGGSAAIFERLVGVGYNHTEGTPSTAVGYPRKINDKYAQSKIGATIDTAYEYMRPSSYHPGGVNIAWTDGRVRFISEDIGYGVFQALMTPRGVASYDNSSGPTSVYVTPPATPAPGPAYIPSEDSIR